MQRSAMRWQERFAGLSCAHVADAAVRLQVDLRVGDCRIKPAAPATWSRGLPGGHPEADPDRPPSNGIRIAGRVLPVQHAGSADIFLEALQQGAGAGAVLVVDNQGRLDEGCIGDLIALEAAAAGVVGIVIWGQHRDSQEIASIALPVFSLGSMPVGPRRDHPRAADALHRARIDARTFVTGEDVLLIDEDGILAIPAVRAAAVIETATHIRDVEQEQARRMRLGETLREQIDFADFLRARSQSQVSLRTYLRDRGNALEQ